MADYNLGTARGVIEIEYKGDGADKATDALRNAGNQAEDSSKKLQKAGLGLAASGAAITAGFALAIKSAASFEKGLSAVQAVSGASAAEMDKVREKALQLGKETKFSAGESAGAIEELVKAGISITDVMNGAADATVALAAAGEVDLATAATIASNAMNQFQLSAEDLPRVTDLIAGAANASAIGVTDLGESLNYVGPVARSLGVSIDDVSTAIAVLGNNGIKGSSAGTALRSVLSNLTPITKKAVGEFKALGLITADGTNKFQDATGAIKPLNEVVQILNDSTAHLSATERNTFAKKAFGLESLATVSILANQTAESFDEMAASILKVSAADVAATRMDNLQGAIEELSGSFETLMIVVGTPFLNMVRDVVVGATKILNVFLELPGPIRDFIGIAGAAAGAFMLITGAMILAAPKIKAYREGLQALAATALWQKIAAGARIATAAIGGPWVAAIVIATTALGALTLMNRDAKRPIEDLTEAIIADGNAMKQTTREAVALRLQKEGLLDIADKLGISLSDVTGSLLGEVDASNKLKAAVDAIRKPYQDRIAAINATADGTNSLSLQHQRAAAVQSEELQAVNALAKGLGLQTEDLQAAVVAADQMSRAKQENTAATKVTTAAEDQLARALGKAAASARDTAGGTKVLKDGIAAVGAEAVDSESEIKALNDAIDRLFGRAFSAPRALNAFKDGLVSLTQAAKDNGTSLSTNTTAGRQNQEAMRQQAEKLGDYITAMRNAGEPQEEVTRRARNMRNEFLNSAEAAGFNRDKVDQLTDVLDEVIGIGTINLDFDSNAPVAIQNVRELEAAAERAAGSYPVRFPITAEYQNMGAEAPGYASGGIVRRKTLAWVGEEGPEAIVPLTGDFTENLMSILGAMNVPNVTAPATSSYIRGDRTEQGRTSGGSRIVQGSLTLTKDSRALIKGWAEDVFEGEDQFAGTYGRMG